MQFFNSLVFLLALFLGACNAQANTVVRRGDNDVSPLLTFTSSHSSISDSASSSASASSSSTTSQTSYSNSTVTTISTTSTQTDTRTRNPATRTTIQTTTGAITTATGTVVPPLVPTNNAVGHAEISLASFIAVGILGFYALL